MLLKKSLLIFCIIYFFALAAFCQQDFIYTKEGRPILLKRDLISNCLRSLNTDRTNKSALAVCECQVNRMNRAFTNRQYRSVTTNHVIDMNKLFKLDSVMEKEIQLCYTSSNQTILLSAQGFAQEMVEKCKENILLKNPGLDKNKVAAFCNCELALIKDKKITDKEMEAINDPNSILFYQVMATCGDPFSDDDDFKSEWTQASGKDVSGPGKDTVSILAINGMHYVKLKVGSVVYFWLLDTGASDMLITKQMEQLLMNEKILSANNYLGTGRYEMANGMIDTCRKYKIDNILIGHYSIGNIVVAVSDKARRVIAGKSLLNKFSNWMIDNKQNILILNK